MFSRSRGPWLGKIPWDLQEASDRSFQRNVHAFGISKQVDLTVKSSETLACLHA